MCVLYVWYGIVVCLLLERGPLWVFLEATAMGEIYTPSKTHKLYRNTMVLIFIAFSCSKALCLQFLYFLDVTWWIIISKKYQYMIDPSGWLRNVDFNVKSTIVILNLNIMDMAHVLQLCSFILEYVETDISLVCFISSMSLLSKLRKEKSVCSKSALGCWKASELASFLVPFM